MNDNRFMPLMLNSNAKAASSMTDRGGALSGGFSKAIEIGNNPQAEFFWKNWKCTVSNNCQGGNCYRGCGDSPY